MSRGSVIKATLFSVLPKPLKTIIQSYHNNKTLKHWEECFKVKVSKEQVDEVFSQLDMDCDVMVHSSLPDIGNIKLKYVTDNLKRYILDRGHTILCPAIPIKGSTLDYLKSIKEFDVRTASNAMGAVSCYYGRQKEAIRSLSPTHSVIALGKRAQYFTEEHILSETPFTEKSPYFKLLVSKGKILMFGSSMKNFTFIRIVDDMIGEASFPVKVYDPRRFEVDMIDSFGVRHHGRFRTHAHKSGRMLDTRELMVKVRQLPSTRIIPLGCGKIVLTDAKDVIICLLENLKNGLTIMGYKPVSEECKQRADYWLDYIRQL